MTGGQGGPTVTGGHGGDTVTGQGGAMVDTAGPGTQPKAALASSLPAPQALLGVVPVKASARAVLVRQSRICAWVRLGSFCSRRATVPATIGAAIEVPCMSP